MRFTLCTCQSTPAVRMLMTPKWRPRNAMRGARAQVCMCVCGTAAGPGHAPPPRRDHRRSAIMTHVTRFYYFNGPPRRAVAHATRILIGRFRARIVLSFRPRAFLPPIRSLLSRVKRDERDDRRDRHNETRRLITGNNELWSPLSSKNRRRDRIGRSTSFRFNRSIIICRNDRNPYWKSNKWIYDRLQELTEIIVYISLICYNIDITQKTKFSRKWA